jgi:mRNA interferase RelE/StbE
VGVKYRIEYLKSVVDEDIPKLTKPVRKQIKAAIEEKLTSHPIEFGKPLRYSLRGARRLRVGDWRVIYQIELPDVVLVVKNGHRREVYDA